MSSHVKPKRVLSTPDVLSLRVQLMAAEHRARVGERIEQAREAKGWTQRELADALPGKVDGPSVSRWERGKVYPEQYLDHLARALDKDVSYFLAPEPDKNGTTPDPFEPKKTAGNDERFDQIEASLREQSGAIVDLTELVRELQQEVRDAQKPQGEGRQPGSEGTAP